LKGRGLKRPIRLWIDKTVKEAADFLVQISRGGLGGAQPPNGVARCTMPDCAPRRGYEVNPARHARRQEPAARGSAPFGLRDAQGFDPAALRGLLTAPGRRAPRSYQPASGGPNKGRLKAR
jgi:hypothetical protein